MTDLERKLLGEANYELAKGILTVLGAVGHGEESTAMPCAECDKYGPDDGNPCMSLRLARDMGYTVTTPEWCKDPGELRRRT